MSKVVKFGGSSLANAAQFRKVGDIIAADEARAYVVPSAPGKRYDGDTKVTDLLLAAYEKAAAGKDIAEELREIRGRYDEIIQGLDLSLDLTSEFDEIARVLREDPYKDYAASRGEFLNGKVMAAFLGIPFVDAYDVIFFDENNMTDYEKTEEQMSAVLKDLPRAVIPGFYGQGADGKVQTFSRGGSDVTGSLVAASIRADAYENWTDVSGFLVADPRIVKDPLSISTITYRELRELSYMGASVLHEDAIFPIRRKGIPINIRNTNRPEDEGTWIVQSTARRSPHTITGIAGSKGFCSVLLTKDMMNAEVGFARKLLQAFEEDGVSIEHMPSGIDTMTIVVHEDEFLPKEQHIVSKLHKTIAPDSIDIESGLALIAVVGRGMKLANGTAGKVFNALGQADIHVRMIDQGSSEINIIIAVDEADFEDSIRCIYKAFVTE